MVGHLDHYGNVPKSVAGCKMLHFHSDFRMREQIL